MIYIEWPDFEEIDELYRTIEKGIDLDDRQLWIYRTIAEGEFDPNKVGGLSSKVIE